MKIEGQFTLQVPRLDVWEFMTDLERVAECMPGAKLTEALGPNEYRGELQVKVGPVLSRFGGDVEVIRQRPPEEILARITGRDRGSASAVKADFKAMFLSTDNGGTEVDYVIDYTIRGRLGQLGQGPIVETSRVVTEQFISNVTAKLEQGTTPNTETKELSILSIWTMVLWKRIKVLFRIGTQESTLSSTPEDSYPKVGKSTRD